jgi:hypothetical protein
MSLSEIGPKARCGDLSPEEILLKLPRNFQNPAQGRRITAANTDFSAAC